MKPTRVRHSIVIVALLINVVCYTDRACLAVAGPEIRQTFGLDQAQMGLVFSIFSISYFLGQTPWGLLADRNGARAIVSFAVAGWSAFTALTAAAWSFASLLVIRLIFGGLEAALSPSIAAAFSRWIPEAERSSAFGAFLSGGRLGAALTPPLVTILMLKFGWRVSFVVFGALGIVWSGIWYVCYRNRPAEHPRISQSELGIINLGTPVQTEAKASRREVLLRSPRLWCLLGAAFGSTFLWQFFITWFPTYLREHRGLSVGEVSLYASLPFVFGFMGTMSGGWIADLVGRKTDIRAGRTVVGLCSLIGACLLMSAGIWSSEGRVAALLMALAAGFVDLYLGAAWSSATDIGGVYGGGVSGLMNASSNCAGFASPFVMGWVLKNSGDWDSVLLFSVGSTFVAAVLWWFVNPRASGVSQPALAEAMDA